MIAFLPSAMAALVAALFVSFLNNRLMLRVTNKQIDSEEKIAERRTGFDEQRVLFDVNRQDKMRLADKIEKAHMLLSSLSLFHSQTNWYIESEGRCDPVKWDALCQQEWDKYYELQMITEVYFDGLKDLCEMLTGKVNCFWMAQRSYMLYENQGKESLKQHYAEEVVKLAGEIGIVARNMQYGLAKHIKDLGFDLRSCQHVR